MTQVLQLIENPGYDMRSEAMSLAHQIREDEGVDMGTALSEAWSQLREDNPIWDNPTDEDDEDEDYDYIEAPRRRASNPTEGFGGMGLVLLGVAGWLGYYYWKNKRFPWQTIARYIPVIGESRVIPNQATNNKVRVVDGFQVSVS